MKTTFFIDYSGTNDFSLPIRKNPDLFNCLSSVVICFNLNHLQVEILETVNKLKDILNPQTETFVCFYLPDPKSFTAIHAMRLASIIEAFKILSDFKGFILNAENFVSYNFLRTPKDVENYDACIEVILNAAESINPTELFCVTTITTSKTSVSGKINLNRCKKVIPMIYDPPTIPFEPVYGAHGTHHGHSRSNWVAIREHRMKSFKRLDTSVERVFVWSFLNLLK